MSLRIWDEMNRGGNGFIYQIAKISDKKKIGEVNTHFCMFLLGLFVILEISNTEAYHTKFGNELADLCGQKEQYFVTRSKVGCKGRFSEDQIAACEKNGHMNLAALF